MSDAMLDRITGEMTTAMKARDAETLSTLRMLKAALMEAKIAKKNAPLSPEEELEIVSRYEKKRRETLEECRKVGREDLAAKEEFEIGVLRRFLPEQLDEAAVRGAVARAVAATGATSAREMGKVMGVLMKELKGRADGDLVSRLVKEALAP
ncbi:MAG: GatB/YqeY domain-containing protein [bacterium]